MNAAGLVTLMLMALGSDNWPEKLDLKKTSVYCREIVSISSKDGYSYVGIDTEGTDYMSDYADADALQSEIDRQCRRGR